jgi:FMN-dependent NADH-azoreductase
MKTLITYYSFSGNTEKVCRTLEKAMAKTGEVSVQRLKPADEIKSFMGQCKAAFTRQRAVLAGSVIADAGSYDLVIIASPVWAFAPTPAVNAYLDRINGLNGKKTIIVLTSGSGVGVQKCFANIRTVLRNKGAASIEEINIQDRKSGDENFVTACIEKAVGAQV